MFNVLRHNPYYVIIRLNYSNSVWFRSDIFIRIESYEMLFYWLLSKSRGKLEDDRLKRMSKGNMARLFTIFTPRHVPYT